MGGGGSGQVGQESLAEGSILPQGGRTKEVRADLYLNISDHVLLWNMRQAQVKEEEEFGGRGEQRGSVG